MSLYYEDEYVTLYHGDCRVGLAGMADKSVAAVITDPPYSDSTHENVRSNSGAAKRKGNRVLSGTLGFDSISEDDLRAVLSEAGRVSSGWVVATLDYKHAFAFDMSPPEGLRMLRLGVWVKPNPMPQISGDRPGMGWEAIAFMHRTDTRPKWNGGGRTGVWTTPSAQNIGHPTAKPLAMIRDWVELFSNPGDTVLDPYAGSGTTLRAAADTGRKGIGYEVDATYCEVARARFGQQAFNFSALGAS
jgi:site-specific DNA-methyltransferase (adenine-specific)